MKHNQIVVEINKRFGKITAAQERILVDLEKGDRVIRDYVEPEDIHRFRAEVKKLRAFLHLVLPDRKTVLPRRLHDYYQALGAVRNLQLQEYRVLEFEGEKADRFVAYCALLRTELATATQQARESAAELFLPHEEARILEGLPEKLVSDGVCEFLWKSATRIQALTQADALLADGELHEIRKCLKEINYNHAFIHEHAAHVLPPAFGAGKGKIEPLLEILGQFQDFRTGLELLQPTGDSHEQKHLATLRRQWEGEKESIRHRFKVIYLPIFQRLFASNHQRS
jgi:CHAD domain-containing protein